MMPSLLRASICALFLPLLLNSAPAFPMESVLELKEIFKQTVDRRLELPEDEQQHYAALIQTEMQRAGLSALPPQYLLLVDRSAQVQAVLLFWFSDLGQLEFIGASPASSGIHNGFEYFETPLGVFDHSIANQDFRAEGTVNSKGIRGYGRKGMRVYDFGWVNARQTWRTGTGKMHLQLHATDPDYLEPRLGTVQSKGCIRIPAALNELIDRYGILDAGYELAATRGKTPWLLRPDREPTPWSGRYLVIVDSQRTARPDWAAQPIVPKTTRQQRPRQNGPGASSAPASQTQ